MAFWILLDIVTEGGRCVYSGPVMLPANVLNLVSSPSRSFLRRESKIRHNKNLMEPLKFHYIMGKAVANF